MLLPLQYGRSDSYRVATTQDKDEKESPKKKGGKDLDDLKKEVPIVCTDRLLSIIGLFCHIQDSTPHAFLKQTRKKDIIFKIKNGIYQHAFTLFTHLSLRADS